MKRFSSVNMIQARLQIGRPNDEYEREADAMADRVTQMSLQYMMPVAQKPDIQMKCAQCEEEEEAIQMKPVQEGKERIQMNPTGDPSTLMQVPVHNTGTNMIQRDEGTSQVENTVTSHTQDPSTHIWSGLVDRREYVPASGASPERDLGTISGVRINFNPDTCTVILPSKLKFEHPDATNWPFCSQDSGNPPPAPQLSQEVFDDIRERYIRLSNEWLNGWYKVRLNNCEHSCAGREMDINVVVEEDVANADTTVVLANTRGRSCASPSTVTIHAQEPGGGGVMDDRLIHESGHMALGFFDEYPVSQGNPDEESVRTEDFSMAGSSSDYRSWMLLHERHFDFVPEFLETIFPDCDAELVEINRPEITFEFSGVFGGTDYQGGGYYIGLGLDFGLPLSRTRDWGLFLGAHTHVLLSLMEQDRTAFLLGARLGIEHTFGASTGGFQWGGYGELGYGTFGRQEPGTSSTERFGAPYYMVGGNLGYSFAPAGGAIPFLGAEGGYGSTILSEEDRETYGNNEWFYLGLSAGVEWR